MSRKRTLTEEEKIKNKKESESESKNNLVSVRFDELTLKRINSISKKYKSRNSCIIDLIKNSKDYTDIYPKGKLTIK